MHKFNHPARPEEEPILSHWTKEGEKSDSYPFAKFNKKVDVIEISEAEYKSVVNGLSRDSKKVIWSKQDTKLLFQLCEDFSLRFPAIADRYNFEKGQELLKTEQKNKMKFNVNSSKRERKCKEKEV